MDAALERVRDEAPSRRAAPDRLRRGGGWTPAPQ
jgi:hypothetical protein